MTTESRARSQASTTGVRRKGRPLFPDLVEAEPVFEARASGSREFPGATAGRGAPRASTATAAPTKAMHAARIPDRQIENRDGPRSR